jgi:hypothetical protein
MTRKLVVSLLAAAGVMLAGSAPPLRSQALPSPPDLARVPLVVERHQTGAPVTLGVPFPRGVLDSPDHVRVVGPDGVEVPSQVTEVTTWKPADPSIKWVWVFFFATGAADYSLEYGRAVRRQMPVRRIEVANNARENGLAEITTGPLRFTVRQGDGGFLYSADLDTAGDGFDDADTIATGPQGRGAFADLLDGTGLDPSRAVVLRTAIDLGSGPLHAVLKVEGEYRYGRADNQAAPFVTRIHAYAGTSYIRVLHTFVYTGVPDRHRPVDGDYAHVATQGDRIIVNDPTDEGWTKPEDQLQRLGLGLTLRLGPDRHVRTALSDGPWWSPGVNRPVTAPSDAGIVRILQTGPKADRIPPFPISTPTERMSGFAAELRAGDRVVDRAERAPGWLDVYDGTRGVAVGVRNFIEEYPKAISFDPATGELRADLWSDVSGPMSFARATNAPANEGAVENWAQGIAKTSELIVYFHGRETTPADVARTMRLVEAPPVAHVDPEWYARSEVFGHLAPRRDRLPELERALDYKFDWMLFNQRWQPWYGMFDYGDMMNTFNGQRWTTFGHGEPAQDYMWWLQFVRTGDPRMFDAALAFSRHLMDVDNTHWPAGPPFQGDSNYPLDYWNSLKAPPVGAYVGVGRRHADQHWMHILSAHVWLQGWMSAYYLAGEHRGLDVAKLTGDLYIRRIWGEHGVTGRRLYLSVWNLTELFDATKDARYKAELDDRVARMLSLQKDQYDSLVMDRYGYTLVYASHGLEHYLDITDDERVKHALVRHARAIRDNPPLNHWMESYLSSIHTLTLGYRYTGDASFLDEMTRRLEVLKMDALPRPIDDTWTQSALFDALEKASHLPDDPNRLRPPAPGGRAGGRAGAAGAAGPGRGAGTARGRGASFGQPQRAGWAYGHGLRIYGWTTAFTVPYALATLDDAHR